MIETVFDLKCPNCFKPIVKKINLDGDLESWGVGKILVCESLEKGEDVGCGATIAINTRISVKYQLTLVSINNEIQEKLL